jgi:hypothetical protein
LNSSSSRLDSLIETDETVSFGIVKILGKTKTKKRPEITEAIATTTGSRRKFREAKPKKTARVTQTPILDF